VLTTREFESSIDRAVGELPAAGRPRVVVIDDALAGPVDDTGRQTGVRRAASGGLAYVIFTSGSTGVPKGAMVEQRGMVNHLRAKVRALELEAGDRVLQNAAQTFDISVWQFLAALLVGGRVEIVSDEVAQDAARLLSEVASRRITIFETVPSLLRILIEEIDQRPGGRPDFSALRWLIPTGEALPPELCRDWLQHFPQVPLLNAYGPTECSDDVTHQPLRGSGPGDGGIRVTIGRALPNLGLYHFDRWLRPVPMGVPGELCVAGIGVGRGYLHEPRRTAEAFPPDPFARRPGGRLYRTGDLARCLADGEIDFLGRIDYQVKVRGFRIELGEIESVLDGHPAVREVVVVTREIGERVGDPRLVAYLTGDDLDVGALRQLVGAKLPDYMMPAAFVVLAAMPLNPNGKIDRRALPAPDASQLSTGEEFVAPRTATEKDLAQIWAALLGVDKIGVGDNFFYVGGHSLLATRLISQVREHFAIELPLATVFEGPTLAELAEAIDVAGWATEADAAAFEAESEDLEVGVL
jgi:amino acid adenylation domain-containing protein